MIIINVINNEPNNELICPTKMIGSPYGTVFQQYHYGQPTKDYYISCGQGEKSIVHIWFDEDERFKLSTDNAKSLGEFYKSVKVKEVNATIEINLTIGKQNGKT